MSAEALRRAAVLMRQRAENVIAHEDDDDLPWESYGTGTHDTEHIASWHPAVALAVADWLHAMAEFDLPGEPVTDAAYAVARAYLGES